MSKLTFGSVCFGVLLLLCLSVSPSHAQQSFIPLDIDGDGVVYGDTDGQLFHRWKIGLTGDQLVNGYVSEDCTRCTGPEVVLWLNIITSFFVHPTTGISWFDIDGDGAIELWTDAYAIILYLYMVEDLLVAEPLSPPPYWFWYYDAQNCEYCTSTEITGRIQDLLAPYQVN